MNEPRVKALSWLQARLGQWQRLCRMQDWRITVEIKRDRDFRASKRGAGVFGETCTWREGKLAEIALMDPTDFDPPNHYPYDMESTLAHEFAHLLCWPWSVDKENSSAYCEHEQAMEAIAAALCAIPVDFQMPATAEGELPPRSLTATEMLETIRTS